MNVLVLAPHPDDESIGCGGTICLHTARKDRVSVVYLTSGELGLKHLPQRAAWRIREKEARTAGKILQAKKLYFLRQPDWFLSNHVQQAAGLLRDILNVETPALIYLPHPHEWHPDHKVSLRLLRTAFSANRHPIPAIRCYEVWTPLRNYDHVENITTVMPQKMKAVRAHRSQLTEIAYDRAIRGLNEYRGALGNKARYAEVFHNAEMK